MQMRLLREQDAEAFRQIRLQALQEYPTSFGASYEEVLLESLEDFAAKLRRPLDHGFVIGVFDPEMIAMGGLSRNMGERQRHKGWIWGMFVLRQAQGRGIGRALLKHMIASSRLMHGVDQLHLTVMTSNEAARRLYQSVGFQSYGIEPRAVKIGDRYQDEELMVLKLK